MIETLALIPSSLSGHRRVAAHHCDSSGEGSIPSSCRQTESVFSVSPQRFECLLTVLSVWGKIEEVGQIFQQDGSDQQSALEAFEQAGEWYSGEDATACVNQINLLLFIRIECGFIDRSPTQNGERMLQGRRRHCGTTRSIRQGYPQIRAGQRNYTRRTEIRLITEN
jgi:hypothetical protein